MVFNKKENIISISDVPLAYSDTVLTGYTNDLNIGTLGGEPLILADIGSAAVFAGLTQFLIGPKSAGKTQYMRDFLRQYFGNEKWGLWEEGRSDYKPKDVFEKLNISVAKGNIERMPEMKAVWTPEGMKYLINSLNESAGKIDIEWKIISETQKKEIENQFSLTTDDLYSLKNIDKKFFCIDEFNRCPEVVMNLFYGLMCGEISHLGKIIKLGDGYYSGIAAANPDNYEGTFKMDLALWARFHVVLDFGFYEPTTENLDALNRQNLSPGIQNSSVRDISMQIQDINKKICLLKPNLEERMIMLYMQRGMNGCTKFGSKNESKSKHKINWPGICQKESCAEMTKLCGLVKGIDVRAIRAVYRLAKGLEIVARMKTGEDFEIDPIDSLLLAYKFVSPYKGVLSPAAKKEARDMESMIFEDKIIGAMKEVLDEKLKAYKKYISVNKGYSISLTIAGLKKMIEENGLSKEYSKIESEIRKKYEENKKLAKSELKEVLKNEIVSLRSKTLDEYRKNNDNFDEISNIVIKHIFESDPNWANENLKELISLRDMAPKEYKKTYTSGEIISYDIAKKNAEKEIQKTVFSLLDIFIEDSPDFLYDSSNKFKKQSEECIDAFLDQKSKETFTAFIPDKNRPLFENELRKTLADMLDSHFKNESKKKNESLFAGEWQWLKDLKN